MAAREKKLLLHEKVEVRSLKDGYFGSWHTGVVSGCGDLVRQVHYDHILFGDGPDKLIEQVKVTPAIDGVVDEEIKRLSEYRGLIRPWPPSFAIEISSLHYGESVDLLYKNAWWEGVVFDHDDGSETRRIFFPDLGVEMEGSIKDLRLSMDWDEVSEEWKPRGNWLFLELIEELEDEWAFLVSVKQLWYEVRRKKGFGKLREWTSSDRELWKELMAQVISDNLKITLEQFFSEIFYSVVPSEVAFQFDDEGVLASVRPNEQTPPIGSPGLSHDPNEGPVTGSDDDQHKWQLAVADSEAEYLPDAIDECNKIYRSGQNKKPPSSFRLRAYKHLTHLGWKIESAREDGGRRMVRKRYTSPAGDVLYSFLEVCKTFEHGFELGPGTSQASSEMSDSCDPSDMVVVQPQHWLEVVRDYHLFCSKRDFKIGRCEESRSKIVEVKKHLSDLGWSFHYYVKPHKNRRELRYTSPTGKTFASLATACKWLLDSAPAPVDLTPDRGRTMSRKLSNDMDDHQSSDMPMVEEFVRSIEGEACKTRMSRKRKMHDESHSTQGSLPPKRGMRLKGDS